MIVLAAALTSVLAGCATPPPPASPVPRADTIVVVDTVTVAAQANSRLEERAARLELELLERDTQIEALLRRLDGATQEAVRAMAKLRTLATRAEAASALAEAEIAFDALGSSAGVSAKDLDQTERLLEQGNAEFDANNYGGAVYLFTEAKALARASQAVISGDDPSAMLPDEELFSVPLRLETVKRSNVRSGPSLRHRVLFTLDANTVLVGRSYSNRWVRVSDAEGRNGWIFSDLVGGR